MKKLVKSLEVILYRHCVATPVLTQDLLHNRGPIDMDTGGILLILLYSYIKEVTIE